MAVETTIHEDDRYAQLTIDRPGAKNALSSTVLADLGDALATIEATDDVRAVVLTGAGDVFSAGADVDEFGRHAGDPSALSDYLDSFRETYECVESFPPPVVAAVNGPAHGGGCELAMSCDLRLAATDAELRLSEINMALAPPTECLKRHLAEGHVRELAYTGRPLTASEGVEAGVFVDAVSPDDLLDRTQALVADITTKSPHALRQAKASLQYSDGHSTADSIAHRYALNYQCFDHEDFAESVAAFSEGRQPDYS